MCSFNAHFNAPFPEKHLEILSTVADHFGQKREVVLSSVTFNGENSVMLQC